MSDETPPIPPDADWADLTQEQTDFLLGGLTTIEATAEVSKTPVATRSGVVVPVGQWRNAVRAEAARDDAREVVREGNKAEERATVTEAFADLAATMPRGVQDLIERAKDEPFRWHVDHVIAHEAKVLLVSQAGAGKTTLIRDTAGALVSGEKWLGHFEVTEPITGSVVVIDAEMHPAMLAGWYERAAWTDEVMSRVIPIPLVNDERRRTLLNLMDKNVQDAWASLLREVGAGALVLDPAADFFEACGLDEDKKGSWSAFQEAVDSICIAAGVGVRVITHHTGWDTDRERGSSRARDWATTVIHLTKQDATDNSKPRVLTSPKGRDVVLPKGSLELSEDGSHLTYLPVVGGRLTASVGIDEGSLEWKIKVLDVLTKAYPKGLSVSDTKAALGSKSSHVSGTLALIEANGWASVEKVGKSSVYTITTSGLAFLDSVRGGDGK
ncbi:AAA family ATPase [Nocardioides sp. InS609-2]|uniref:AAA family ATPase n=1 Tax=Nocardioides sp. InS609-2 TaxID=2760705 RepID=UPI0020BEDB9D|nr:AAA family ATPase [Nocardioides sp. InS609-2]